MHLPGHTINLENIGELVIWLEEHTNWCTVNKSELNKYLTYVLTCSTAKIIILKIRNLFKSIAYTQFNEIKVCDKPVRIYLAT